ncbi:YcaO-like family protein [Massilia sp. DWR3-1-1]|uniref:YcaO-like family protein n=1 Tax=Massilia sp. DWR3-1-1 TaxID=2804559 RepID=UPI003CF27B38
MGLSTPLRDGRGDAAGAQFARLQATLVGATTLVRHLVHLRAQPGAPRIHNCACALSSTAAFLGADIPGATGAAGLTAEAAGLAALGEAAERYACAVIPWERLTHASAARLGPAALGMDAFPHYLPAQFDDPQFPVRPWTPATAMYWARAHCLASGAARFVPAPLVYIPYLYRDTILRSDFVAIGVSTGASAGPDRTRARLGGLLECIERDAFMIVWMRRLRMPRLDIRSNDQLAALYDKHYAGCRIEFHLVDITLDIAVPTVLCIGIAQGKRGPFAVVGCATRTSLVAACAKALLEAAQCHAWASHLMVERADWRPAPDYANIVEFEDHVRLYCEPEMVRELDFLVHGAVLKPIPAQPPARSPEDDVRQVQAALAACGLDAVEVDLTPRDIAEAGLQVVKILVPGLAPLTSIHSMPALASPRYQDVPARLGLAGDAAFNRVPHPFP